MTDYNDGNRHIWHGGKCPVHEESEVKVWLEKYEPENHMAGHVDWLSVVMFAVTKPYAEPKVIWVNKWPDGTWTGYDSEEDARANASIHQAEIAVEYVEKTKC